MRIAITGHTSGIGRALAGVLKSRGHEILGLSRREGYNIGSFVKIANLIEPCDVFINNAQVSYAQTELLYEVWNKWRSKDNKHIWCISTIMTQHPVDPLIQGQDEIAITTEFNVNFFICLLCNMGELKLERSGNSILLS